MFYICYTAVIANVLKLIKCLVIPDIVMILFMSIMSLWIIFYVLCL